MLTNALRKHPSLFVSTVRGRLGFQKAHVERDLVSAQMTWRKYEERELEDLTDAYTRNCRRVSFIAH
jgi:hypothetical protein